MRDLLGSFLLRTAPKPTDHDGRRVGNGSGFVVDGIQRDFLLRKSNLAAATAQCQSTNLSRHAVKMPLELLHFHESVAAFKESERESHVQNLVTLRLRLSLHEK